jgi:hypothetical protein
MDLAARVELPVAERIQDFHLHLIQSIPRYPLSLENPQAHPFEDRQVSVSHTATHGIGRELLAPVFLQFAR